MTQTTQSVSPLRQRMIDDMMMRKLSPRTQNPEPVYPFSKEPGPLSGPLSAYGNG